MTPVTPWTLIQSPTDAEMSAVQGTYLVADNLPLEDAHLIAAAPDLLKGAERLIAVFGQTRMTAAERIICGISDAGLRTEGNAAIAEICAAIAKAQVPT